MTNVMPNVSKKQPELPTSDLHPARVRQDNCAGQPNRNLLSALDAAIGRSDAEQSDSLGEEANDSYAQKTAMLVPFVR